MASRSSTEKIIDSVHRVREKKKKPSWQDQEKKINYNIAIVTFDEPSRHPEKKRNIIIILVAKHYNYNHFFPRR
jgi:hypothetical protein